MIRILGTHYTLTKSIALVVDFIAVLIGNVGNVAVGTGDRVTTMSKFEYVDDAALIDEDATTATARVTAI